MKFTRILSLFLALLMVATLLVACKNDEPDEEESPEETETVLQLNDEGATVANYVIVRDYKASNAVIDAVNNLVASIKLNIGCDIEVRECFNDLPGEELDVETEKEILIGMTNRAESEEALRNLRSSDYTISVHGSKLVIGSSGDAGTIVALTKFLNDFVAEQGNRFAVREGEFMSLSFSSNDNINESGHYAYSSATLLGIPLSYYTIFYPKNADNSAECQAFGNELSALFSKQTGYEPDVRKDTGAWAHYEILIGDTIRTEDGLCESLGDNEYYIKLIKTQVTCPDDNTPHDGGQLIVCFGKNAKDAAFKAFSETLLPYTPDSVAFTMEENFELTNRA